MYICFLGNPQNLDIGRMLGDDIKRSPFHNVLVEGFYTTKKEVVRPRKMLLIANSHTPIHSRAWCALDRTLTRRLAVS